MLTRRDLLKGLGALAVAKLPVWSGRPLRLAVIADVHHGLAPDATDRLKAFVAAANAREVDLAIQMGDFCHAGVDAVPFLQEWSRLRAPKLHVLGNHDMDRVDKATAMRVWGMESRYGSRVVGGYRLVWLDLNHFRKAGRLHSYANGNYFTSGASHNWADAEQLEWLRGELGASPEPVIVLSHQPLGIGEAGKPLPPEQQEVMDVIAPSGKVAACLCGHLHVDRLEFVSGIPCVCVNSASYFWSAGMHPYTRPLFAFLKFTSTGLLVDGVSGEFLRRPPVASDGVPGRSASILDRRIPLP